MGISNLSQKPWLLLESTMDESEWSVKDYLLKAARNFFNDLNLNSSTEDIVKLYETRFDVKDFFTSYLFLGMILSLKKSSDCYSIYKVEEELYFVSTDEKFAFSLKDGMRLGAENFDKKISQQNFLTVEAQDLIDKYVEEICSYFVQNSTFLSLKMTQTFMIQNFPKEIKWIARKGLTHKYLGEYTEALKDLKLYQSLSYYPDKVNCLAEESLDESVQKALVDLQGLDNKKPLINPTLH